MEVGYVIELYRYTLVSCSMIWIHVYNHVFTLYYSTGLYYSVDSTVQSLNNLSVKMSNVLLFSYISGKLILVGLYIFACFLN